MSVYLKDGLILLHSDLVATDAACCCCECCPQFTYTITVTNPFLFVSCNPSTHTLGPCTLNATETFCSECSPTTNWQHHVCCDCTFDGVCGAIVLWQIYPAGCRDSTWTIDVQVGGGGPFHTFDLGSDPGGTHTFVITIFGTDVYTITFVVDHKTLCTTGCDGACCVDAACSQETTTGCRVSGGTFLGIGTPCTPNPC